MCHGVIIGITAGNHGFYGWVNLQQFPDLAERDILNEYDICDWMSECVDFLDTAALIANLDLLICVDTSISHLAGVMNKPVWLLNRFESDWRRIPGSLETVWYPSMRIFNQPAPGAWGPVVAEVEAVLRDLLKAQG